MIYFTIIFTFFLTPVFAEDTFIDNFDTTQEGATIDGVNKWQVILGDKTKVISQSSQTPEGKGKALKFSGSNSLVLKREDTYGSLDPCTIEFLIKPSLGKERVNLPTGKIASLSFDYTGTILASDGETWVDTGFTFDTDSWYRVSLTLDFLSHTYNLYISQYSLPEPNFNLVKENLSFIDTSINSLNAVGFEPPYRSDEASDIYIDDFVVYFISKLQFITSPQEIVKGKVSTPFTVQLQNDHSEPQTAWRDLVLELRSSSPTGEFSISQEPFVPVNQVIIPEGAQEVSFYYRDSKAGKHTITVNEFPKRNWDEATQVIDVVEAPFYFNISATSPQIAGEYFPVEILALNEQGEIDTSYNGEVNFIPEYISPSSGTAQFNPSEGAGFVEGRLNISLMYPDAGRVKIKVEDKNYPSRNSSSGEILFLPYKFLLNTEGNFITSKPFNLSIKAINKNGDKTSGYNSECLILAYSPQKELKGIINPDKFKFEAGEITLSPVYNQWGDVKIKVQDENYPNIFGESETLHFFVDDIGLEVNFPPGRDFFYAGENFDISIFPLDGLGNTISNYEGEVNIEATSSLLLPAHYKFSKDDKGRKVFKVSVDKGGVYSLKVEEGETKKTKKIDFEVKEATLIITAPPSAGIGSVDVGVKLVDEEGNVIPDNTLEIKATLEEENPNSSVYSQATKKPLTLYKGRAQFSITESEAEEVGVMVFAPSLNIKSKAVKIKFGHIAKTGIGTFLWREKKR